MTGLRAWAPSALWALAIFTMSALPARDLPALPVVNADKVVHAIVYAGLAALIARALRLTANLRGAWLPLLATLLATGYGASDELHQRLVAGRSSDVMDLVADGAGALLGALTYTLMAARRQRPER
jgi:VanZ family protein